MGERLKFIIIMREYLISQTRCFVSKHKNTKSGMQNFSPQALASYTTGGLLTIHCAITVIEYSL